jgi:5-methylthioadenosine/S-adenosylhomocysteine deaminase
MAPRNARVTRGAAGSARVTRGAAGSGAAGSAPNLSAPIALRGRVVTMDGADTVLDDAVVYASDAVIVDVRPAGQPPPAGFENVAVVQSGGTIFPGLIELHNHLPYDVLPLWKPPKKYGNRDQWSGSGNPDYRRLITGPMQVLGAQPAVAAALVRYVETRCLLGGTTTSQGITLAKDPGIVKHFRGLVRNIENTGDKDLPNAVTHIADVVAKDGDKFLKRVSGKQKMILHLAEGTDPSSRQHFAALEVRPGTWAITPNLIGIHCVALKNADFAVFAKHGGNMVWSPLSNLLLYGQTANIKAALNHGVPIALGSDWAPSGSKNLLGELKVARLAAARAKVAITSRDLVAMVTRTPAAMLGWDRRLGSLQAGHRADLVVATGTTANPYDALIDATEAELNLIVIDGTPRAGIPALMAALGLGNGSESVQIAGKARVLNLTEATADPDVAKDTVAQAAEILRSALQSLPDAAARHATAAIPRGQLRLAVEGLVDNHMSSRPHLPYNGRLTGPNLPVPSQRRALAGPAGPLPALPLVPLTAVDDPDYYESLKNEINLPDDVKSGLLALKPA